jgi:hypothetical protein
MLKLFFNFMWIVLVLISFNARADERVLDIYQDPVIKYLPTIPGMLIKRGYKKIAGISLKRIKSELASIHFIDDSNLETFVYGGARRSGRYDAELYSPDENYREVRLNVNLLMKLYDINMVKFFVFHEALGALRYHDEDYQISAYFASLLIRLDPDSEKEFIPRSMELGRMSNLLAEGGTHAGGGGDIFSYMVKFQVYLNAPVIAKKMDANQQIAFWKTIDAFRFEMPAIWSDAEPDATSVASRIAMELIAFPSHCPNLNGAYKVDRSKELLQLRREVIESDQFNPDSRFVLSYCAGKLAMDDIREELSK